MAVPTLDQRGALTRRPADSVVMHQEWRQLLFLHWEVAPDSLQVLLPPGLTVDLFEGRAYLGIVPFFMDWKLGLNGFSRFGSL